MAVKDSEESVFCRLFSYRNRPGKTSEEDFLTEAYATVLLADKAAASRVLRALWDIPISPSFVLSTQRQHGGNRPDMEVADETYLVFQENKVGADFGELQIERYQDCIQEQSGQRKLTPLVVTCTLFRLPPSATTAVPHIHLTWADVYTAVRDQLDSVIGASVRLWKDFLTFLEYRGMQPFTQLDRDAVSAFPGIVRLRQQLWQLLELLVEDIGTTFSVQSEDSRTWPGWYVAKPTWNADGLLIQPYFEFNEDGNVYVAIRLRGEKIGQVVANTACREAFRDVGWGNWDARISLQEVSSDFLDSDGNRQEQLAKQWVAGKLALVEACGLLRRRSSGS